MFQNRLRISNYGYSTVSNDEIFLDMISFNEYSHSRVTWFTKWIVDHYQYLTWDNYDWDKMTGLVFTQIPPYFPGQRTFDLMYKEFITCFSKVFSESIGIFNRINIPRKVINKT